VSAAAGARFELGASPARLEERIRDATRDLAPRQREAEELARVARTLTEDLDVPQVADRIVQPILKVFAVQSSVLWLREPDARAWPSGSAAGRAASSCRRSSVPVSRCSSGPTGASRRPTVTPASCSGVRARRDVLLHRAERSALFVRREIPVALSASR
jgi:GAF domain-containing protein